MQVGIVNDVEGNPSNQDNIGTGESVLISE